MQHVFGFILSFLFLSQVQARPGNPSTKWLNFSYQTKKLQFAQIPQARSTSPIIRPSRYVKGLTRVHKSWIEKNNNDYDFKNQIICERRDGQIPVYEVDVRGGQEQYNFDYENDWSVITCTTTDLQNRPVKFNVIAALLDEQDQGKSIGKNLLATILSESTEPLLGDFPVFFTYDVNLKNGGLRVWASHSGYGNVSNPDFLSKMALSGWVLFNE